MVTELRTRVTRRVTTPAGTLVVSIETSGIRVRAAGKKKSVLVTYRQLAKLGLQNEGYSLSEMEWSKPVQTLRVIGRKKRVH
jgi:hypothetical protein